MKSSTGVSIHALLAECDPLKLSLAASLVQFQSTHSLRSATDIFSFDVAPALVSIHALLAECDEADIKIRAYIDSFNPRTPCGVRRYQRRRQGCPCGFNPRTPCGVRPIHPSSTRPEKLFQSTHSLRSATSMYTGACHEYAVSIHALLAECDVQILEVVSKARVSIHALLAECDFCHTHKNYLTR